METLNLIGGKNATHLYPNRCIDSNLVGLRRGERLRSAPHVRFTVGLAHYGLIKRLAGLTQPAAGGGKFVYVTSPNLLHAHSLVRTEPDGLHQSLLQLLLLYLIRTHRAIATKLWNTKRPIDSAYGRHWVVTPNLR